MLNKKENRIYRIKEKKIIILGVVNEDEIIIEKNETNSCSRLADWDKFQC